MDLKFRLLFQEPILFDKIIKAGRKKNRQLTNFESILIMEKIIANNKFSTIKMNNVACLFVGNYYLENNLIDKSIYYYQLGNENVECCQKLADIFFEKNDYESAINIWKKLSLLEDSKIKKESAIKIFNYYFDIKDFTQIEEILNCLIDDNKYFTILLLYHIFYTKDTEKASKLVKDIFDEDILYFKRNIGKFNNLTVALYYDYLLDNKFISKILYERCDEILLNDVEIFILYKKACFQQFIWDDPSESLNLYDEMFSKSRKNIEICLIPELKKYIDFFFKPYQIDIMFNSLQNISQIFNQTPHSHIIEKIIKEYKITNQVCDEYEELFEADIPDAKPYFIYKDYFFYNKIWDNEDSDFLSEEIIEAMKGHKKVYLESDNKIDNLPDGIESLFLIGSFNNNVDNLPLTLKNLVFDMMFDKEINFLPDGLEKILFIANKKYEKLFVKDKKRTFQEKFDFLPRNVKIFIQKEFNYN